jgi:nicotinamide-nucleotide amidase
MMPENAKLFENSVGTAPGMWMQYKGAYFLSMPGVPSEMKQIMLEYGLQKIQSLTAKDYILHSFIRTIGIGETIINQKIEHIVTDFPPELSLAYLPGVGSVKLRITARGKDEKDLKIKLEKYTQLTADQIRDYIYSFQDEEIQYTLYRLCCDKGITIGTAESCTGGGIASRITEVPGSSGYFEGSIVSYSNKVKQSRLGVKAETLRTHGAVSEQTVIEMVKGAIPALGVDIALAVSGIAGPGGAMPGKPVGTVWIAAGNAANVRTRKIHLSKNRILNIEATEKLALNEVRNFILEYYDTEG